MIRMMGRFVLALASLALITTAPAYGGKTTVLIPQPGYVPKVGDRAVLYSLDNEAIPSDLWCATTSQACRTFLASLFAEEKDEGGAGIGTEKAAGDTRDEGIVHLAPKTDVQLLERESVELPGANGAPPMKCAYFAIKVLSGPFQGKTLYTLDFHITRLIEPPASGTTTLGAGDQGDVSLAPSLETAPPLIPLGPETTNAPPPPSQTTAPNATTPTGLPALPLETPAESPKSVRLANEPPAQLPGAASDTQVSTSTSAPAPASTPPQMITLEVEGTPPPATVAEKPAVTDEETSALVPPPIAGEAQDPAPAPAPAPKIVVSTPATPSGSEPTNQVSSDEARLLAPLPRIALESVPTPEPSVEAALPPAHNEVASSAKGQDEPAPMISEVPPPLATAATPSAPIAPLAESPPRQALIQGADATRPARPEGVSQPSAGAASPPGLPQPEVAAPAETAVASARPQPPETATPRHATPIFATPAPGPAPDMLAAARQLDGAGKTFEALAAYRRLIHAHPGTTEARTAALRISPLDDAIETEIQEKRAARVLERVRSLEAKGERTLVLEYLQQIVAVYPKTATAREAREHLQNFATQPASRVRR